MLDGQSEPNPLPSNSHRQDPLEALLASSARVENVSYSVPAELVLRLVNAVRRVASGIDGHIHIVSQQTPCAPAEGRADGALPQVAASLGEIANQIERLSEIAREIAAQPPQA